MKSIFTMLFISALLAATSGTPVDYEQNPYDTEKLFKDIPEYIDLKKTRFGFRMTNWFITGLERGLYNDSALTINSDCFGDQFVSKINEFEHILKANPFGDVINNILPAMSLVYQVYFMFTTKCGLNEAINDFMLYCWYRGCVPMQYWEHIKKNFLYILRNINDAGIVWYEGVPEDIDSEKDIETWINLSETTGRTSAEIFIDLTGFKPLKKEEMK